MPDELELKTIVPDPAALRERLAAAGARPAFRGLMEDRRYDLDGQLTARDEVLRVRRFLRADGVITAELTWKGPTRRSADGYKLREELSCWIEPGSDPPGSIVEALGYTVVQAIDRWVELFELGGADAIVFTAGIGENRAELREAICANLAGLGIELDSALNAGTRATETVISKPGSRVKLVVIPTNEELVVARETKRLLENSRN